MPKTRRVGLGAEHTAFPRTEPRRLRLPAQVKLIILEYVFYGSAASSDFAPTGFPDSIEHNYELACTFVAARTAALNKSSSITGVDAPESVCHVRIEHIADPLLLRAALAAALPCWRVALREIPALWARIAVSHNSPKSTVQVRRKWKGHIYQTFSKGDQVLDAVREAVRCAREQPLNIVITCKPLEGEVAIGELSDWDADKGQKERDRLLDIMALLAPHIAHWRYLRVCTVHPATLPVPSRDFGGTAPLLRELHLHAAPLRYDLYLSTKQFLPAVKGDSPMLDTPHLHTLTVDEHIFCAGYICKAGALSAVHTLTISGLGLFESSMYGLPVLSVRTLRAFTAQMLALRSLVLDGPNLSLKSYTEGDDDNEDENEDDEEMDEDEDIEDEDEEDDIKEEQNVREDKDKTTRTRVRRSLTRVHCARLSAEGLGEALILANPMLQTISQFDTEDNECVLEVADCELPCSPELRGYTHISLVRVVPGEAIKTFLAHAGSCMTLSVRKCTPLRLEKFGEAADSTAHGPDPAAHETWLVPRLTRLSVDACEEVEPHMLRALVGARWRALERWKTAKEERWDVPEYVARLKEVTLDGRRISIRLDANVDWNDSNCP